MNERGSHAVLTLQDRVRASQMKDQSSALSEKVKTPGPFLEPYVPREKECSGFDSFHQNSKVFLHSFLHSKVFNVSDINSNSDRIKYEENIEVMSNSSELQRSNSVSKIKANKLKVRAVSQIQKLVMRNITNIKGEEDLRGKSRVAADGFAEDPECLRLMDLAKIASVQGDGYLGKTSPHSKFENFEGVSLGRVALMVYFGLIEYEVLELFLNVSERGRDYVERHFNLKDELYFSYTHLVCRTALINAPKNREDMSHAIHADNCNLLSNGDCTKKSPSYFWRDYSAIIYLNDNFEGGEFLFTSDVHAKVIQSEVKPQCGRLVGFSAGRENLHGVRAVRSGKRCAVGIWFTFDSHYAEIERTLAEQLLDQVKQKGSISDLLRQQLENIVT